MVPIALNDDRLKFLFKSASLIQIGMGQKESMSPPPPFDSDPFDCLKRNFTEDELEKCFRHFDSSNQGTWSHDDFRRFLSELFSNKRRPYLLLTELVEQYFQETDFNQDNRIDFNEFQQAWKETLKTTLKPVSALVIVDVQNDFISGSLALHSCPANHQGEEVVPIINRVLTNVRFDVVAYTYDWHPHNHISFYENRYLRPTAPESKINAADAKLLDSVIFVGPPKVEQVLWPAHCVQHTRGADLHKDLILVSNAIHVFKGANPNVDSYSAFWDNMKLAKTSLDDQLRERNVTDVYVVGLATDVCVAATAMHSIENNYRTILIEDACRGVDEKEIEVKRLELNRHGCIFVESTVVPGMVDGIDRRPELTRNMFEENLKKIRL
ncbi:unnamed protein product, partial [Didymodactylos carnosus]